MLTVHKENGIMPIEHEELSESAKEVLKNLYAENTRRAYKSDLKDFHKYLNEIGKTPEDVTSNTIINYLDRLKQEGKKYSTIQRHLVAIRSIYKQYGEKLTEEMRAKGNKDFVYINPASTDSVKNYMKSLRRTIGTAQKQKRPATKRIMHALLNEIDGNRMIDIRNRALLALGYAGAFRRSELANLKVKHIEWDTEGIYITVQKSKTDQEAKGIRKYIYYGEKAKYCPVRLLETWLKTAGITEGYVFRQVTKGGRVLEKPITDRTVYNVVQDVAEKAGLPKKEFGGHSLRAGLITQLANDETEERDIMRHSGHKSIEVMRRYIREVDIKKKSPTKGIL